MCEPQPLTTLRASKACRGENFTLPYIATSQVVSFLLPNPAYWVRAQFKQTYYILCAEGNVSIAISCSTYQAVCFLLPNPDPGFEPSLYKHATCCVRRESIDCTNAGPQFRLLDSCFLIQRTRIEHSLHKYSISYVRKGKHLLQLGCATAQASVYCFLTQRTGFEPNLHKHDIYFVRTGKYHLHFRSVTNDAVSFLLFEPILNKYFIFFVRRGNYQLQLGRSTAQAVTFLLPNPVDRVRA
jgi:hypothetical protein